MFFSTQKRQAFAGALLALLGPVLVIAVSYYFPLQTALVVIPGTFYVMYRIMTSDTKTNHRR